VVAAPPDINGGGEERGRAVEKKKKKARAHFPESWKDFCEEGRLGEGGRLVVLGWSFRKGSIDSGTAVGEKKSTPLYFTGKTHCFTGGKPREKEKRRASTENMC